MSTKDARRRQILDAAVGVFADQGFHDARIQDVAKRAGVAYGLVYHYFGSKQALLREVFDENWSVFADVCEQIAASDRSPSDALRAILDYVVGAFRTYPDAVAVLTLEYGRNQRHGELLSHAHVGRVRDVLTQLFRRRQRQGTLASDVDCEVLAMVLLGSLETTVAAVVARGPDADPTALVDRFHHTLVALFRDGLTPDTPD
jgi:TetR/AcrR family fatty acid metabolism transcriptional regulator